MGFLGRLKGTRKDNDPALIRSRFVGGGVSECAFTPDGSRIVYRNAGAVEVIDADSGAEVRRAITLNSAAFNPEGTRAISGAHQIPLSVMEVGTGAILHTLAIGAEHPTACAFSQDGRLITAASGDNLTKAFGWSGSLRLWDAETGDLLRTMTGHGRAVTACAFSSDGTRIVAASGDLTLRMWDAETGSLLRTMTGHKRIPTGCAFSPDGRSIVSSSLDGTLRVWDAETGIELRTITGHDGPVHACAFSPDGGRIVSGGRDKTVRVWDAATGVELRTLNGHTRPVETCAFSPDGARIVSGSMSHGISRDEGSLNIWDARQPESVGPSSIQA